jgi:DNA-binding response OmpR family regulator
LHRLEAIMTSPRSVLLTTSSRMASVRNTSSMHRRQRVTLVPIGRRNNLWVKKWGFDVQPAFTGNEALDSTAKTGFDIVLPDCRLPGPDGLEAAKLIRKKQPDAAIFLLTAFQFSELSMDAGLIDSCFNKPLDLEELQNALRTIPRFCKSEEKLKLRQKQLQEF